MTNQTTPPILESKLKLEHGDDLEIFYNANGFIAISCSENGTVIQIQPDEIEQVCGMLMEASEGVR